MRTKDTTLTMRNTNTHSTNRRYREWYDKVHATRKNELTTVFCLELTLFILLRAISEINNDNVDYEVHQVQFFFPS